MKKSANTLINIVNILNDGFYHDGTSLGAAPNISRNAVWKWIHKLIRFGIAIDAVKGRGYRLLEPLILLDQSKIKELVAAQDLKIEIFTTLGSTNDYLQKYVDNHEVRVCLAEQQTRGKGRFNRAWHSPFAQNIYCSLLYPFAQDIGQLGGLSLVIGLAVVKTLKNYDLPCPAELKWPNDIVYQNHKLGGILIEVKAEANGVSYLTIGIGININMLADQHNDIAQQWTSLRKITNNYIDRNPLAADLINNVLKYLAKFSQQGMAVFLAEWHKHDALLAKKITLKQGKSEVTGIANGINDHGELLLRLKNGNIHSHSAGETSVI